MWRFGRCLRGGILHVQDLDDAPVLYNVRAYDPYFLRVAFRRCFGNDVVAVYFFDKSNNRRRIIVLIGVL